MPRRYEEDEEDDDRPRRRRPARRPQAKKSAALPWLLAGIGVFVLIIVGVVVAVLVLKGRKLQSSVDEPPGAVAHWSFDEAPGGRVEDRSGWGHHATLVGAQLGVGGPRGRALVLDGSPNQYCDLGGSGDFNFPAGSSFTITGWFQTFDLSGTIFSLRHTTLPTQVEVLIRDGRLLAIVGDDNDRGRQGIVWAPQANDGGWHHFALIRNDQRVELYLDGFSQGASIGLDAGGTITTNLRAIGCERLWATTNDTRWGRAGFVGGIDEVYVYNRTLTPVEVQKLAR
jgi:sialidase-1